MAPKKTERLVTACRSCRRRKVRCSRARPSCEQCALGSFVCQYDDQVTHQAPQTYRFVGSDPTTYEAPVNSSSANEQPRRTGDHSPDNMQVVGVSADRFSRLEARVERLREMLHDVDPGALRSTQDDSQAATQSRMREHGEKSSSQSGYEIRAYLSKQGAGKLRYVEPSFWAAMSQEVDELDEIINDFTVHAAIYDDVSAPARRSLESSDVPSSFASTGLDSERASVPQLPAAELSSPRQSRFERASAASRSLLDHIPSRNQCDDLLNAYFHGCHPLVPLVHRPTFIKKYDVFWTSSGVAGISNSFLSSFSALLVALLYAGSVASSYGRPQEKLTMHLRALTSKALRIANFPKAPTLDTLRAYMIVQSQEMKEEEPLTCIAFVGLALRAANILGLHRDPSHFEKIGVLEAEERRRTWWHLVHTDVLIAIAAGLPPLIDSHSSDVREISSFREDSIQNGSEDPSRLGRSHSSSTAGILAQAKLRFTMSLRLMLEQLQNGSKMSVTDLSNMRRDFVELGDYLEAALSAIPELTTKESDFANPQPSYEENADLNRWARLLLSLLCDQRYAILSYPLLRNPATHVWKDLYHDTIVACTSSLVKFAQLRAIKDFSLFYWAWPGNHQPLHAIVIVLNDVLRSPLAPHASRARYVVDMIFTLRGHEGSRRAAGSSPGNVAPQERPLLQGGSEVWTYLRRLRAKAWRAADLDPGVTLSFEDVVAFCTTELESVADDTRQSRQQSRPPFPGLAAESADPTAYPPGSTSSSTSYDQQHPPGLDGTDWSQHYPTGLDWMDWNLSNFMETDDFLQNE